MNLEKIDVLIKEHADLYYNLQTLEIIPEDDPDLLRMEEIMEEIDILSKKED